MSELSGLSNEELDALEQHILNTPTPPLGIGEEVGLVGRALASFGRSPQGKQNILDQQNIGGVLRDPVGFDWGDIADFAGEALPTLFSALGSAVGLKAKQPARFGALGAGVGRAASNTVGTFLGSNEGFDPQAIGIDALLGGTMDKIGGGGALKAANPFGDAATTSAMKEVRERAERFGVDLPADALSEGSIVGGAAARARNATTAHGDELRLGVANQRQQEQNAFERIAESVGVTSRAPRPSSDFAINAVDATRNIRMEPAKEAFEKARSLIPDSHRLPVVTNQTRAALRRMASRAKLPELPSANITSGARKQIQSLTEDLDAIRTFDQLDAFRQKIGDMLNNRPLMEEMSKQGDVDFRDVYGGLARDLEESIPEGLFEREFGGQISGQIGQPASRSGVPQVGRANASAMEAGELGESGLPTFPGREGQVARGQVPQRPGIKDPPSRTMTTESSVDPETGRIAFEQNDITRRSPTEQRPSGELMDELGGRADAALTARKEAAAGFEDLMTLDRKTIVNMLKDPGQAENLYHMVFKRRGSVDNLKVLKQVLGAAETEGGAATSAEGVEAFAQIQAQVFRDIREAGEDAFSNALEGQAVPFYGKKFRTELDALGGVDILTEAIGPQATKSLYDFAEHLIKSTPTDRPFSPIGSGAGKKAALTFWDLSLIRRGLQEVFDAAVRMTDFPAAGKASSFLTEGLVPTESGQGVVRALGNAALSTPIRSATAPTQEGTTPKPSSPGAASTLNQIEALKRELFGAPFQGSPGAGLLETLGIARGKFNDFTTRTFGSPNATQRQ